MDLAPETLPKPTQHDAAGHTTSIWQLGLSLVGLSLFWGAALVIAMVGLLQLFSRTASPADALSLFLMSGGLLLCGILLLPSASFALLNIQGRPRSKGISLPNKLSPTILILIIPLVLLLGYWASKLDTLAWLLLPLLHIFAIGLPILLLVYIALHCLPSASPQRNWGVFASGLTLGPMLIFFIEIMALVAILIIWIIWLALRPDLVEQLYILTEKLQDTTYLSEDVLEILGPYLFKPMVVFAMFSFGAVIIPLIEEAIKPIGVWLLVGSPLTPALGFTAGALSGAGYALLESLALSSAGGEDWLAVVVARAGTAGIHILTTALMGWALANAWQKGSYMRLGLVYVLAVLVHGLWNGLTLLVVLGDFSNFYLVEGTHPMISQLFIFAPYGLIIIALISYLALFLVNKKLQLNEDHPSNSQNVVL